MRTAVLGFLVVIGLVVVAAGAGGFDRNEVPPQRVPLSQLQSTLANADMLVASSNVENKYQQIVLIDPKQRVISVYHVEFATGAIALRSVRSFQYDQKLMQYNGKDPLPDDIKTLLSPR